MIDQEKVKELEVLLKPTSDVDKVTVHSLTQGYIALRDSFVKIALHKKKMKFWFSGIIAMGILYLFSIVPGHTGIKTFLEAPLHFLPIIIGMMFALQAIFLLIEINISKKLEVACRELEKNYYYKKMQEHINSQEQEEQ